MEDRINVNGKWNFRRNKNLYLMLLPFMSLFFFFTILPVLFATVISFTIYDVINPPRFVGLDNFIRLFVEDDIFTLSIRNTFTIAIFIGPVGFILSFTMAWFINELPRRVRAVLVLIFYAPSLAGNAFMLFSLLFSNDRFGWLNSFLISRGLMEEPILFLSDPTYMMPIVIGVSFWMSLGFGFLGFVAGLQTLDKSQFEAGYVDGIQNRWQELWFITLPNMIPQLMFGAVLSITGALGVGAITTSLMGFPSAQYAVHTMSNHLDDFGLIRMEMGYASAIAIVMLVMMLSLNKLFQRFLRRLGT